MEENENFVHDKYGYCYYSIEPSQKPIIFNLYTELQYRRKGYARKHLQYVIDEIRRTGYDGEIQIEVEPRENSIDSKNLKIFYKSMGLEIVEIPKKSNEMAYARRDRSQNDKPCNGGSRCNTANGYNPPKYKEQ